MEFLDYWKSLTHEEKEGLADRAGSSLPSLSQVANGHRGLGRDLLDRLLEADSRLIYQNKSLKALPASNAGT